MQKESTVTEFKRDIVNYALKKADNGTWFYSTKDIVAILKQIYGKTELHYADSTIERKVNEARKSF